MQLALQGELRGRGLARGGVCPCGSLLVVPLLLLLPPGTHCTGIQVLSLAAGTGDRELLLVPWCRACLTQHVTGFYINMRCSPRIAETYFKVLFSCLPKDATQSTGPRAAVRAGLDPEEIWDLSGCRCSQSISGSVQLLLPLPFPFWVAQQVSTWPVPQHLCGSGPLSRGRCLRHRQQLASSSQGRWPGRPRTPTEPGVCVAVQHPSSALPAADLDKRFDIEAFQVYISTQ